MNMVDFCTGQLFDWFVAGKTAFALIERLPAGAMLAPAAVVEERSRVAISARNKDNYLKAKAAFNQKDMAGCMSYYAADHQLRSRDVGPGRQQGAELRVAAGAQPGGERRVSWRGHLVHVTSPSRPTTRFPSAWPLSSRRSWIARSGCVGG